VLDFLTVHIHQNSGKNERIWYPGRGGNCVLVRTKLRASRSDEREISTSAHVLHTLTLSTIVNPRRLEPTRTTHTFLFVTMYLAHRMRTFLLSSLNTRSPTTWRTLYLALARSSSVSDCPSEISSTQSSYPLPGQPRQLEDPSDPRRLSPTRCLQLMFPMVEQSYN
jgi:hypothetical protein